MPGEGVGVAFLALEAVHHLPISGGHIVIALFAVGRGQPTLFLAGVEVEGLQNVLVCELDVAGALFVKRGGEVVKLDLEYIDNWSLIFTKLDETCCLGNMLNMKLYTDAPLSYTTSGQNVPNDIEVINEQGLAKLLLGGNS